MTRSIPLLATVPALLLSACTIIPQPAADGFARIGQTTRVGAVRLRPERVVEDSRCPMNARCVWAGRVTVEATVWQGDTTQLRNYTLGEPASDGIVLDTVEPGRMTDTVLQPGDYRLHFSMQP